MRDKLKKLGSGFNSVKGDVTDAVVKVAEHPKTKAAADWAKDAASDATTEAISQVREVSKSLVAKHAATGAAIGAVVAVPVPIVGPIFGAIVGGGIGAVVGVKRALQSAPASPNEPSVPFDFHKEMTELDDLRKKGILTQKEFDQRKRMLLRRS